MYTYKYIYVTPRVAWLEFFYKQEPTPEHLALSCPKSRIHLACAQESTREYCVQRSCARESYVYIESFRPRILCLCINLARKIPMSTKVGALDSYTHIYIYEPKESYMAKKSRAQDFLVQENLAREIFWARNLAQESYAKKSYAQEFLAQKILRARFSCTRKSCAQDFLGKKSRARILCPKNLARKIFLPKQSYAQDFLVQENLARKIFWARNLAQKSYAQKSYAQDFLAKKILRARFFWAGNLARKNPMPKKSYAQDFLAQKSYAQDFFAKNLTPMARILAVGAATILTRSCAFLRFFPASRRFFLGSRRDLAQAISGHRS